MLVRLDGGRGASSPEEVSKSVPTPVSLGLVLRGRDPLIRGYATAKCTLAVGLRLGCFGGLTMGDGESGLKALLRCDGQVASELTSSGAP